MTYKWIGAILVIVSCGGWGVSIAWQQRARERLLRQLMQALSFMEWELQYRLTPLPELCRQAGRGSGGSLRQVFTSLADRLDSCAAPDVSGCMKTVLRDHGDLPVEIRRLLHQLGRTLGRFDLPGQLQGLAAVRSACKREEQKLSQDRDIRLRNCRTLGLCAGAALVILFA